MKLHIREDSLYIKRDTGRKMGRFCFCMQQNSKLTVVSLQWLQNSFT